MRKNHLDFKTLAQALAVDKDKLEEYIKVSFVFCLMGDGIIGSSTRQQQTMQGCRVSKLVSNSLCHIYCQTPEVSQPQTGSS